jgi:DNA-binding response OmpR family regulator
MNRNLLLLALPFKSGKKSSAMRPRILFVDDEAPIRETLSLCFRRKGYDVITATSGKDAMECASRDSFDLAILDVGLAGGENGFELLGHFKKTYPQLPVIMFTGLSDKSLEERAMAQGAVALMWKTDKLDNLLGVVQAHIRKT